MLVVILVVGSRTTVTQQYSRRDGTNSQQSEYTADPGCFKGSNKEAEFVIYT